MPKKPDIKPVTSNESVGKLAARRRAAMDAAIDGPPPKPKKPAKTEKMGCGGKVKKMAKGGKTTFRGAGAARRGKQYKRAK